jgi:hypothetical protein
MSRNGMATACVICWCATILVGCANRRLETEFFFKNPPATRVDRLRQYSLEDQYRLFRYGNDKFEPPLTGLAIPIAERGQAVVPFLLGKIDPEADDVTVRDVLLVFERMAATKSYDVKSDAAVMETLHSRVLAMKDAGWRVVCANMLRRIEANENGHITK